MASGTVLAVSLQNLATSPTLLRHSAQAARFVNNHAGRIVVPVGRPDASFVLGGMGENASLRLTC